MPDSKQDNEWPDEEYVPYLEAEQKLYAWVLIRVGGVEPDEALQRGRATFHYEPIAERGLITHAGAWRIAMADLFGDHTRQPKDFGLTAEYDAEVHRLFDREDALTEEQRQELERRLAELKANPKAGSSWEEVKARLRVWETGKE